MFYCVVNRACTTSLKIVAGITVKMEVVYHVNSKVILKIDFHDWMTIRILLCYLLTSDSITIGVFIGFSFGSVD